MWYNGFVDRETETDTGDGQMTTEIFRHRNSLEIRWTNDSGDEWAATKRFNLGTRILESATISYSGPTRFEDAEDARRMERELRYAAALAETMDRTFTRPEDFDLVSMADEPALGGYPALISPPDELDGRIYIAIPNL